MADIFSGTIQSPQTASNAPTLSSYGATGMNVLGGVFSYFGKMQQAKAIRAQAKEEDRRQALSDAQTVGTAVGLGAASGIEIGSTSLQTYLTAMQAEMAKRRGWALGAAGRSAGAMENAAALGAVTDVMKLIGG